MEYIAGVSDLYHHKMEEFHDFMEWLNGPVDPRVEGWLLMSSFQPSLQLSILYVLMVLIGPKLMSNRDAFKLTWALIPYNIALALLNAYITFILFFGAYSQGYNLHCQKTDRSYDYWEYSIATAIWWYYFSKLLEFSDTLFFVLRKKNKQLSFLHVYHHVTMFISCYIWNKWFNSGFTIFFAATNAAVHVPMYTYYGLAALSAYIPAISKHLWWKRYMTVIQLTQFVLLIAYGVYMYKVNCGFPTWMIYGGITYITIMLALFLNFYLSTYKPMKKPEIAAKKVAVKPEKPVLIAEKKVTFCTPQKTVRDNIYSWFYRSTTSLR